MAGCSSSAIPVWPRRHRHGRTTPIPPPEVALDDEDNVPADSRAMDQARALTPVVRGYGIAEGADRDLIPGLGS